MRKGLLAVTALILVQGCTCRLPSVVGNFHPPLHDSITLYSRPLDIRLSKATVPSRDDVLVLYATGDGGWRGLDEEIFDWLSSWNYPVAGFSARSYLKNLGYVSNTTTPGRLVEDFERIISFAEQRLDMPQSSPIILVGLSRGAGLDVVAAGEGKLTPNLAGLVAIALTKEEEHVVHYRILKRSPAGMPTRESVHIETYEYLPRITSIPVVVLQSTHDGYLPANDARALFGPDTAMRKLIPINARNHRFTGGCEDLYRELEGSLAWVRRQHGSSHAAAATKVR